MGATVVQKTCFCHYSKEIEAGEDNNNIDCVESKSPSPSTKGHRR